MGIINQAKIGAWHTLAAATSALMLSAASAQTNKAPDLPASAEKSAQEQYRDLPDNERAAMIERATAKSAVPGRAATVNERALISESPATARARLNSTPEGLAKSGGTGAASELRSGGAVGKVVGTALSHNRMRTISADGKHVDTCETGVHTHDSATEKLLKSKSSASKLAGSPTSAKSNKGALSE
jgi:hypothetical protein